MKVTVEDSKAEKEKKKYPWIGVSDDKLVVMFHSPNTGMVLRMSHSTYFYVGYLNNNWDEKCFKKFTGTITLENG